MRHALSSRRGGIGLAVAVILGALAIFIWQASGSRGNPQRAAAAPLEGPVIAADGTLTYPAVWRAKVADLSQRVVSCLVAHGSKKAVSDGDVSYPNTSDGGAYKACAAVLAENEALNTGPELAALDRRAAQLMDSFRACDGQDDVTPAGLGRAARAGRDLARCAGDANAAP